MKEKVMQTGCILDVPCWEEEGGGGMEGRGSGESLLGKEKEGKVGFCEEKVGRGMKVTHEVLSNVWMGWGVGKFFFFLSCHFFFSLLMYSFSLAMLDILMTKGIHYFEIIIRRGESGSTYLGVTTPSQFQFNKIQGKI